jgi:hypothetical protein
VVQDQRGWFPRLCFIEVGESFCCDVVVLDAVWVCEACLADLLPVRPLCAALCAELSPIMSASDMLMSEPVRSDESLL